MVTSFNLLRHNSHLFVLVISIILQSLIAIALEPNSKRDNLFIGTIESSSETTNVIATSSRNGNNHQSNNILLDDGSSDQKLDSINVNVRSLLDMMQLMQRQYDLQMQTIISNMRSSEHKIDKIVLMLAQMQLTAAQTNVQQSDNLLATILESNNNVNSDFLGLHSTTNSNRYFNSGSNHSKEAGREKRTSIETREANENERLINDTINFKQYTGHSINDDNIESSDNWDNLAGNGDSKKRKHQTGSRSKETSPFSVLNGDNLAEEDLTSVPMIMEQLTSMKNQLNKLLNREMDRTYQYNSIADQLIEIKDECSVTQATVATIHMIIMNSSGVARSIDDHNSSQLITNYDLKRTSLAGTNQMEEFGETTLKSSDLSAIAKMLNKEIDLKDAESSKLFATNVTMATSNNHSTNDSTKRNHSIAIYDVKRQLDEINSVVKHVAQLINKRQSECKSPIYFDSTTDSGQQQTLETATTTATQYNNSTILFPATAPLRSYNDEARQTTNNQNKKNSNKPPIRWFSDSGKLIRELVDNSQSNMNSSQPQSKTNNGRKTLDHTQNIKPLLTMNNKQQSSTITNSKSNSVNKLAAHHHHQQKQPTEVVKCNPTTLVAPKSCLQLKRNGANCSGQYYTIKNHNVHRVYCDMEDRGAANGGGWTVVLRRIDQTRVPREQVNSSKLNDQISSNEISIKDGKRYNEQQQQQLASAAIQRIQSVKVGFDQDWESYKFGFGHLDHEFWLGLDLISLLTTSDHMEAQIDLESYDNDLLSLHYDSIKVYNETHNYRLHIGRCNDTRGAPFEYHNHSEFWTQDHSPLVSKPLTSVNQKRLVVVPFSGGGDIKTPTSAIPSVEIMHYDSDVSASTIGGSPTKQTLEELYGCSKTVDGAGWWFVPGVNNSQATNSNNYRPTTSNTNCYWVLLTAPTPLLDTNANSSADHVTKKEEASSSSSSSSRKGLFWPSWKGEEALYRVTLKIRQKMN